MEQIPALKSSVKLAKSDCIKLVHKFIFDCNSNRQNKNNLRKFEGFKFRIEDTEFEAKLNDTLEKFTKIELIQITNFLQTEVGETEIDIAHKIISLFMDLDTFSSSFKNDSDAEDSDLSQNSQKTDKSSLNMTSREKERELSPDARSKENISSENLEIVNESKLLSKNLKQNEDTLQYWEKREKNIYERDIHVIEFNHEAGIQ